MVVVVRVVRNKLFTDIRVGVSGGAVKTVKFVKTVKVVMTV